MVVKHLTASGSAFRILLVNMLGCSQDDPSRYLGWRSKGMALHYTRMSNANGSFPIPALRFVCQTPSSHPSNLQCFVLIMTLALYSIMFCQPLFVLKFRFGIMVIKRNLSNGENYVGVML